MALQKIKQYISEIKILLVDDREDNLISIESILAPEGYKLTKANSGREALKILLKERDFNLILMDVKMPGLSGFETASLIYDNDRFKKIPIIFITAYSYSDEKVYEGYKTGAVDYIYKPIKPQLLKAKVAVFVDLYRKTQQLMEQEEKLIAANKSLQTEIKERKHSEEQVNELNRQLLENIKTLESANAELERFAYVASHDLQEPLRKIQTYGDLLKTKYTAALDKEGKYYVQRMQDSAQRLQKLIKDILVYSRLTSGQDFFVQTELNTIVDEILVDLELKIKESGARVSVERLPVLAVVPGQIRQLFQNIISNALKFSRPGVPPEITISCDTGSIAGGKAANGQQYCNIYIRDNGIGFDEVYSEQIFTLFKRLNDHSEGTGIGLAICKKIVEQHKGYIHARSKPNQGSTFVISLPVTQQTQHEASRQIENSYS
ncbi:MAG: response regulator [Bacteroidota bacterium]